MPQWLEQALGTLLVLVVLLDVFLTVLYARMGTGFLSYRLGRITWLLFRGLAKPFGPRSGDVLSLCGPALLVLVVLVWASALTLGAALVMHPMLGTSIRTSSGDTPTDFIAALYAGGSSMAIVGASDFTPHTGPARLLYLFNSLVGASVLSLTLSYLVQVYSGLQQRNALGLKVDLLSDGTGDAAELVAGLGPRGEFSAGYSNLTNLAADMTSAKEAHHFYPVLFYFRFRTARYSVSRISLLAFDTVTLIRTALDHERYGWLEETASMTQLRHASMMLVTSLEDAYLPGGLPEARALPDQQTVARWRRRYFAALRRLQQAGIQTASDKETGAESYVALRGEWDRYVAALAPSMAYDLAEIDPAGSAPEPADELRESETQGARRSV
ncbi:MAG: two pore domain potassium channel family protein [Geminicoccaceae bacterium]